jgi:hypothetical protein
MPEINMLWRFEVKGTLNKASLLSVLYLVTLPVVTSLEIKNLQEDS